MWSRLSKRNALRQDSVLSKIGNYPFLGSRHHPLVSLSPFFYLRLTISFQSRTNRSVRPVSPSRVFSDVFRVDSPSDEANGTRFSSLSRAFVSRAYNSNREKHLSPAEWIPFSLFHLLLSFLLFKGVKREVCSFQLHLLYLHFFFCFYLGFIPT